MFSHIVVAWDGSDNARRAFDYSVELAQKFQARIQLVSVAHHAELTETEGERRNAVDDARRFYSERSAPLVQVAAKHGVAIDLIVVEGSHPAESIVDTAHKVGADLIVVGRRGLSGVRRFLMGSTTDRIAHYAHCPVLIVNE